MSPDDSSHPKTQQGGVNIGDSAQITIGQGDVVGRDKIVNVLASKEDARTRRDHLILLNKVREFWVKGVLEKSVHSEALIELGKQEEAYAVERERPWDMALETSEQESRPIPPGKKIIEIFDETDRALLILGAPGSGKTITLLELARDLIARAEADPAQPIPVVFNLSAWAERRQPLAEWMTDELSLKYQIPRKIGRKWLAANDILPMLDGLDEVQTEQRSDCVEAINAFYGEHSLAGIAVCSRREEYSLLKAKLKLGGAILIQPLNDEQVTDYIASFGTKLAGLYKALRLDTSLKELAASPLMLGVMSLAYADVSLEDVLRGKLDSIEARRKHLVDAYIERMFKRKGEGKLYTPEQTVKWLAWLARGMKAHGQSVFLIEEVQPSWLRRRWERWLYVLGSRSAGGLLIGLALGSGVAAAGLYEAAVGGLSPLVLVLAMIRVVAGTLLGLFAGATAGPVAGLRFEWNARHTRPQINSKQGLLQSAFNFLAAGLGPGSVLGGVLFTLALADEGGRLRNPLVIVATAFVFTLPFVLVFSVLFGLIFGSRGSGQHLQADIPTVEALNWSWTAAFKGAAGGLIGGLITGALLGLMFTVLALLIGVVERSLSTRAPLAFLAAISVCGGTLSFFGAAIFGLINGLQSKKVEIKLIPNQGIRQSARNAVFSGLLFGMGGMLIVGAAVLLAGAISTLFSNSRFEPGTNLLPGLGMLLGAIGGMYNGCFAVIQHYTLRIILALNKHLPWNIARFLDYCADRIFLQKVGGGYIFIHRLLLEYFAERG